MINPVYLCNKHLNGEHGELHKHRHVFLKKQSISGRIHPVVQIEPASMKVRHDELSEEMIRRGMQHKSPYEQPDLDYLPPKERFAKVDATQSFIDLTSKCELCKSKIMKT